MYNFQQFKGYEFRGTVPGVLHGGAVSNLKDFKGELDVRCTVGRQLPGQDPKLLRFSSDALKDITTISCMLEDCVPVYGAPFLLPPCCPVAIPIVLRHLLTPNEL